MNKTTVVTTRLDAETLELVDRVAAANGRTRAWFAAEAIRRVATAEAEFLAFVQVGIDAAECGDLTPQDQVFADVRTRRQTPSR